MKRMIIKRGTVITYGGLPCLLLKDTPIYSETYAAAIEADEERKVTGERLNSEEAARQSSRIARRRMCKWLVLALALLAVGAFFGGFPK